MPRKGYPPGRLPAANDDGKKACKTWLLFEEVVFISAQFEFNCGVPGRYLLCTKRSSKSCLIHVPQILAGPDSNNPPPAPKLFSANQRGCAWWTFTRVAIAFWENNIDSIDQTMTGKAVLKFETPQNLASAGFLLWSLHTSTYCMCWSHLHG